jgi:hypothetical protein
MIMVIIGTNYRDNRVENAIIALVAWLIISMENPRIRRENLIYSNNASFFRQMRHSPRFHVTKAYRQNQARLDYEYTFLPTSNKV